MNIKLSKKQNVKLQKNFRPHLQMFMLEIIFTLKILVQVVIESNL